MLGSREDAEDVLQEVFAAAFNAICADDRPINARPWLYRIARNRCLNHLRRPQPTGQDTMDVFERDGGTTTADTVHRREEFRHIVADVQELPETQRTALLLREIDALTYEQIAEAMDTTVPSVKSLLVRARVALAEAAEARLLTCDEVRMELGSVAEGIARTSPPIRRHLKTCERCRTFRVELRRTSKALAAMYPIGPLLFLKKIWLAKLGFGGAAGAAVSSSGGAAAGGVAGTAATAASGITAGGAVSAGVSTLATKAAAGMAAAVIVTAGAVEVKQVRSRDAAPPAQTALASPAVEAAATAAAAPAAAKPKEKAAHHPAAKRMTARVEEDEATPPQPATTTTEADPAVTEPASTAVQEDGSAVTLPGRDEEVLTEPAAPGAIDQAAPPTDPSTPPAGEPTATQPASGTGTPPAAPLAATDPAGATPPTAPEQTLSADTPEAGDTLTPLSAPGDTPIP
jgi:RNA polymerase sigma factor (sigma-70 family)